jgi:signal transduction histidine kinase
VNKEEKTATVWMSSAEGGLQAPFEMPLTVSPIYKPLFAAMKKGEDFLVKKVGGKALERHFDYLLTLPGIGDVIKQLRETGYAFPETMVYHFAFFNNGFLSFHTHDPYAEAYDIFRRFAKVFEQTYTRFLDLQKAEAQARESQVQLALERVRARTMAMQHSDELKEAAALLFQQAKALGVPAYSCGYNLWEKNEKEFTSWMSSQDGSKINGVPNIPLTEDANFIRYVESKQKGEPFFVLELRGERMQEHYQYLKTIPAFKGYFDYAVSVGFDLPDTQIHHIANFSRGNLLFISLEPCPEFHDVFKRFAAVFEQTYTRFLDLQKAEAQARESQIQLALERVRARTMAMQKSNELSETVFILFRQFKELGENPDQATIGIINEDEWVIEYWVTMYGNQTNRMYKFPIDEPNVTNKIYKAWKEQKSSLVIELSGKELYDFATFRGSMGGAAYNKEEHKRVINVAFFSKGLINVQSNESRSVESIRLLERFAGVFEQTYTRFLDLQKAEAQARESQIQLALERVRARTMAMQKSDELPEAANLLFQQVQTLGMPAWSAGYCIWDEDKKAITLWMSSEGVLQPPFRAPLTEDPSFIHFREAHERGETFFVDEIGGEELVRHYKYMRTLPVVGEILDSIIEAGHPLPIFQIFHLAYFSQGFLLFITYEPVTDAHDIFKRFGKVFEQTYTRFLDLQKAEAQAREAKIEASLEKVRSRTMAMQRSSELGDAAKVLFNELNTLVDNLWTCGFVLCEKNNPLDKWWLSGSSGTIPDMFIPNVGDPIHANMYQAWLNGYNYYEEIITGEALEKHYEWLMTIPSVKKAFEFQAAAGIPVPTWQKLHCAYFSDGYLAIITEVPSTEQQLFKRFALVFEQTYTRFLDLQKAEAQARESQIEAALERVRSRTMAMQNSDELAELVATVFTELNRLEFALTSCIIWINNPELLTAEMWVASTELNKPPEPYYIKPFRHPYFKSVLDAFKEKNKKWVYEMKGEEKKVFQEQFFNEVGSFPTLIKKALEAPESVVYSASFYNFGALEIVGTEHVTDAKFEILHRLGKVFDMSYTRFNDLKQAEAQAQEAKIETALERVRSRTLAMQKSDELAETAAVLFRQLILLGIAPNRLYIGIIKDDNGHIEFWVTDEDGSKVSTQFTGDINRNASMKKMYGAWKEEKKSLTIDMHGKELENYFHYLSEELNVPFKQGLSQKRRIQSITFFGKGFIGIASPDEQPEATINLLERFAAVFNLTYTRFNDLKVAEAHAIQAEEDLVKLQTEKKRAEDAVTELRTTQAQLIQSEKMASLGELTAGIAHEIQNPLNFVNNFSEVNTELIAEMKEEIDKGNIEEVRAIANDIADNEQKINHHGKRADAIVKGMLQHSRSSSATKEPTDINKLADEYLRLAYHGLRAKDKTFNATVKTDYDESIGYLNIVPQDIGRVILNLITNAFYVIHEKKIQQPNGLPAGQTGYEPTISISTKKINNIIELTVMDNGNGIPQKVVNKIFQPFFTTKPTGQGTGLGLSLSYDIIKAHGGEIKVETNEGEGSEFIILLPL